MKSINVMVSTVLWMVTTSLLVLGQSVNSDVRPAPSTILEAEKEGAVFPKEAEPVALPDASEADTNQGTSERKCVEFPVTYGAVSRRSGEFIVGGSMGSLRAGMEGKVWWAPLHDPASRNAVLVVRSARLDEPSIKSDFKSSQYAWPIKIEREPITASVVDREHAFYPSGFGLPSAGRWLLVVSSAKDWGCFVVTVGS